MITVQKLSDGKNLTLLVKGFAPVDEMILSMEKDVHVQGLRIDSVLWQIQEKMGLHLFWGLRGDDVENSPDLYAMTFESRGSFRLDQGMPGPRKEKGWNGELWLRSFREDDPPSRDRKAFVLVLDFEKLGDR